MASQFNDGHERQAKIKLVLLGDSAVGKTTLISQYVTTQFTPNIQSTIGAAFITKTLQLDSQTSVKFEIWDTAGQERYKSLAPMYYRGADFAIVVFDISEVNGESWNRALKWVEELKLQGLRSDDGQGVVVKLVGNKADLIRSGPGSGVITEDVILGEVERLSREGLTIEFVKTSAKTGEGVKDLFQGIAEDIPLEKFIVLNGAVGNGNNIDLRSSGLIFSSGLSNCSC